MASHSASGSCHCCQSKSGSDGGPCCCDRVDPPGTLFVDVLTSGGCNCGQASPLTLELTQLYWTGCDVPSFGFRKTGDPHLFCQVRSLELLCDGGELECVLEGDGGALASFPLTLVSCDPFYAWGTVSLTAEQAAALCGNAENDFITVEVME